MSTMSSISRLAVACAAASAMVVGGAHAVGATVITDPTGNVSVATGTDSASAKTVAVATGTGCAQAGFGVAVSPFGCSNGTVAVSGTGEAFGGVAISGTGEAVTDSDLTPFAVSGTGEAAGSGDLGAYTVSGTGQSSGSAVDISGTGYACYPYAEVEISLLGHTCGAPIQFCGGCFVTTLTVDSWGVGQATRRS
jgi:hypothetical protein